MRGLLSVREGLVRARTRWILLVRAILRREGLQVRSGHAESFATRVDEVPLPDHLRVEIAPLLACLAPLNAELGALDKQLERLVVADEAARRLTTVPGVGPVTALSFVATVDRVERFESSRQVPSYLGLVPREWSSSETLRRGRITKAGNKRTRWLLAEAARSLLRFKGRPATEHLRAWAEQIGARRGSGVAVVALARRLSGILFAMWRDGTEYDPEVLGGSPRANRAAKPNAGTEGYRLSDRSVREPGERDTSRLADRKSRFQDGATGHRMPHHAPQQRALLHRARREG